jgi:tetratricopeptide (TPR) repeat protein
MATFYSSRTHTTKGKFAAAILFFFATAGIIFADQTTNGIFAARAELAFHRAQIQFQMHSDNSSNAWIFARASYDFADFAKTDSARADIANQGIAAARELIAREPKNAAAHYYLAMDLGQLARTELLGALSLVKQMEREFKTTITLDENLDFAGPARNLGLLYLEAPSIGSIGSERKARNYLQRAVKLAPEYPENHLNLAEAYLQWREPDHAKTELNALDAMWSKAQTNFTGEHWEESWADWTARRAAANKKLAEISAPVKSPR